MRLFAIEAQRFDRAMRLEQDGAARRFIAAPALHADVAVLDNVETADAVFAAKLVELFENLERRAAHPVDRHRIALVELDGDDLCIGRRVFRIFRPAPDAVIRSEEHTSELQSLMRIS